MNWSPIIKRLYDELRKVQLQIEGDELYAIAGMIDNLRFSYRIYHENLVEFRNWATAENLLPITFPINDPSNREANAQFLITLSRLFFNVLSSASMYSNHSVAVKNRICCKYPDFESEYERTVSASLQENEVFCFMKDLRHFFTHAGIAQFFIEYKFQERITNIEDLILRKLKLDTGRLKKWDKWTQQGKKYLNSVSEDVSFYTILNEFDTLLKKAYESFVKCFKQYFHQGLTVTYQAVERERRIWVLLDRLKEHNRKKQAEVE